MFLDPDVGSAAPMTLAEWLAVRAHREAMGQLMLLFGLMIRYELPAGATLEESDDD